MPSWVSRTTGCDAEEKERKAKERKNKEAHRERTNKHNERKNKEAHRERVNKHNERKNKEAHRERVNKQNEQKNKAAHRERVNKHNERKHKAANTCKHGAIIYQHYHFRGYARHFHRGRYDMHAMMRKGVKNDDASSAKVYGGCKLIIYQHSRFNGRHASFVCNHNGWCNFDWNHFTRRGVGNDHTSSLRV